MIKDIKLTIAIPTRNRCESLKKVVSKVCERVSTESLTSNVEVMVVDDWSSTDNTEAYVKLIRDENEFLFYHRCSEDLGFDKKLLQCFELAN
jgi:glycosyltransferase involved in cell wall biosynthesis